MNLVYRISDHSYSKPKLPGATKEVCLNNFLSAFSQLIFSKEVLGGALPPMTIIADLLKESNAIVSETGLPIIKTDYGNAGSLRFAFQMALERFSDDELVYFVEDDYLHLSNAQKLIEEGIALGDYVTLYDHPDKYTRAYDFGEVSRVFKTSTSHWRFTCSTCMTFAVRVGMLREDIEIWKKHINGDHPNDHKAFIELQEKGRKLVVCIPGAACHTDLTVSGQLNSVLMEEWALEYMIQELDRRIRGELLDLKSSVIKDGMNRWDKLKMLDALVQMNG